MFISGNSKISRKIEQKRCKTMAAISKEFIKIEFVQQPKKEKATELRIICKCFMKL